jgi:hypothetical protein
MSSILDDRLQIIVTKNSLSHLPGSLSLFNALAIIFLYLQEKTAMIFIAWIGLTPPFR